MARYRYYLTFLIVMLSIGVNVGQNMLIQFNIERNYMIISLVAISVAGLIAHRNLFFIVLVAGADSTGRRNTSSRTPNVGHM